MKFIAAFLTVVFCASSGLAQETIPAGGIKFDNLNYPKIFEAVSVLTDDEQTLLHDFGNSTIEDIRIQRLFETICTNHQCGSVDENRANQLATFYVDTMEANLITKDRSSDNDYRSIDTWIAFGPLVFSAIALLLSFNARERSAKNEGDISHLKISSHENTKGEIT